MDIQRGNRETWGENLILAIETTGQKCSVALIDEKGKPQEESSSDQLNHLTNLIPMINELLLKNKLTIKDIKAIAVSEGPGSFTGIRIGISTARALAQCLNLPAIGVPTLRSFVEPYLDLFPIHGQAPLLICPMFDARREEIYGAAYLLRPNSKETCALTDNGAPDSDSDPSYFSRGISSDGPVDIIPQGAYELHRYLQFLKDYLKEYFGTCAKPCTQDEVSKGFKQGIYIKFMGDGTVRYSQEISKKMSEIISEFPITDIKYELETGKNAAQSAEKVAMLSLKLYNKKELKLFEDLQPVYLRKAEAERKLEQDLP